MTRVLITGGAGFIGSNLALELTRRGRAVTVLDSLSPQVHGVDPASTSPLLRSLEGTGVRIVSGSVTSPTDLLSAFVGADAIVHLAAETGTGQSMYEVDRYVEVNVGGTARLLQQLSEARSGVRRVVVASSRAIYGEGKYLKEDGTPVYPGHRTTTQLEAGQFDVTWNAEQLNLDTTDEESKIHPSSVYGITKHAQEQLTMTVCPTLGIEAVALRYQNVYGPGQSLSNPYTGILSIFSNQIQTGEPINIFEDGLESRDFVYIDDVIEGTIAAIDRPEAAGQVFNIGSGVSTTVAEVVEQLFRCFNKRVPTHTSGNFRIGDIRHNVANVSKARSLLGFVPSVTFAKGVERFVRWVTEQPTYSSNYQQSLDELRVKGILK